METINKETCKRCKGQGWYMTGEYGAKRVECGCTKIDKNEKTKCPECLDVVHQDELNIFGGLCEFCAEEN